MFNFANCVMVYAAAVIGVMLFCFGYAVGFIIGLLKTKLEDKPK